MLMNFTIRDLKGFVEYGNKPQNKDLKKGVE